MIFNTLIQKIKETGYAPVFFIGCNFLNLIPDKIHAYENAQYHQRLRFPPHMFFIYLLRVFPNGGQDG